MDRKVTVRRIKAEYRKYLHEQHPEWEEDTVRKYVTDAFYLYNNDNIAVAFWKCFESDESMAAAGEEIFAFLAQKMEAEQAKEQADDYLGEMERLKAFLDAKGGVKAYIGSEYDCEETIYKYAKLVYDGAFTVNEAAERLEKETPYDKGSIKKAFTMFKNMMDGTPFTFIFNIETMVFFISRIGEEYGRERVIHALNAVREGLKIRYKRYGESLPGYRSGCAKLAKKYQIDLDFGDGMFEGIVAGCTRRRHSGDGEK